MKMIRNFHSRKVLRNFYNQQILALLYEDKRFLKPNHKQAREPSAP